MNGKVSAIDFTEELYTAIKDIFIAEVKCGVTEITVNFIGGDKFKITVEKFLTRQE